MGFPLDRPAASACGPQLPSLTQPKEKHPGPLRVHTADNAYPLHRGQAVREYLRTPEPELMLVNMPGYSPDFNARCASSAQQREMRGHWVNACTLGSNAALEDHCLQIPGRAVQPETRAETALPYGLLPSRAETLPRDSPASINPFVSTRHYPSVQLLASTTRKGVCCFVLQKITIKYASRQPGIAGLSFDKECIEYGGLARAVWPDHDDKAS